MDLWTSLTRGTEVRTRGFSEEGVSSDFIERSCSQSGHLSEGLNFRRFTEG